MGVTYYNQGKLNEALSEFNKALAAEPENEKAKYYVNKIFNEALPEDESLTETDYDLRESGAPTREGAMQDAFNRISKPKGANQALESTAGGFKAGPVSITGEVQARAGFTDKDSYWRRANWDLNEKNWRILSGNALNRYENTYDPRIYDRLRVNLDANNEQESNGFGFHGNITVDPWSYTGKSSKINVTSAFGDTAQFESKYIGSTNYTLNETIYSSRFGNTFALPELKLYGNHTNAVNVGGAFTPADTFYIPEMQIHKEFQPVREFWFDYKQDDTLKIRFYPIGYENQALVFDDPLRLSGNRTWWEDNPWIRKWTPGIRNTGLTPVDFTKGRWDKTNSFSIKDSEGQRLTALRGFALDLSPREGTSFSTNFATPKDIWQDYAESDNVISATRLKQQLGNSMILGLDATARLGFNVNERNKLDAQNYVLGADLTYELFNGLQAQAEFAHSESKYDMSDTQYETEFGGNAYYVALMGRLPFKSILHEKFGYDSIKQDETESNFTKFRLFASRMDDSFDQPLSSYIETRDDEWWGRHLRFRKPFKYYYQGEGQLLTWDDIKTYKLGTGIDVGRSTLGLRIESTLLDNAVDNLFDVRNVHYSNNGKFVENVARDEITWRVTDKFTAKAMGIYQKMPKTKGGIDPFTVDPDTGRYFTNSNVQDGMNASLKTGSLGAEYEFFDWLALNGIWEHTNDYYLGYDGFPRTIFNGGDNSYTYWQYGNKYRGTNSWLYNQQYFPAPPYKFYNIFKTGLRFNPLDNMDIYLDYTCNNYRKAGQVDDNMNHVGIELAYTPMPKFSMFLKYTYSRWQDLQSIAQGIEKTIGHHNAFAEFIYRLSADEDFTFQYGEASRDPYMGSVLDIGWDPYGGSLRTIDTQHIFRLYYRRRF
jgi:hypothetical protein